MKAVLIQLIVKHFISDVILQSDYQRNNKGKFLHFGGILHALIHASLTGFILFLYKVFYIKLVLIDFVSHYIIDYCKVNLLEKLKYDKNNIGFWIIMGIDQILHFATYGLIYYLLVCQI